MTSAFIQFLRHLGQQTREDARILANMLNTHVENEADIIQSSNTLLIKKNYNTKKPGSYVIVIRRRSGDAAMEQQIAALWKQVLSLKQSITERTPIHGTRL